MELPKSSLRADILVRAKAIETLYDDMPTQRAIAIRHGRILAIADDPNKLDDLIGKETKVIDKPSSTVLPAFNDTHTHLILAGLCQFDVPVNDIGDLNELFDRLRQRAASTPKGQWICTATDWQEFNLKEQRLPTLAELDAISTKHPILVRRGGHNMVVNSVITKMIGVTRDTQSPPGGVIGKEKDGSLNGKFQDSALAPIEKIKPSPTLEERIAGLEAASRSYAATGTGCVRDCYCPIADLEALKATHDAGKLNVRVRALIPTLGLTTAAEVEELLDDIEKWRYLQRQPWLSVWGIKFMVDGGIEAGATEEPYDVLPSDHDCCAPAGFHGIMLWKTENLTEAMSAVIRRAWQIGTHAYGDRAITQVLNVYEILLQRFPYLPRGSLVLEHGGLASQKQQQRAVDLGIAVTIQQPLHHDTAGLQEVYWGSERVARIFPARQWLDKGALVTGGSDYPVGKYAAMRSIWGMATRETVSGVRGPEHAITVEEAISLHTTKAVELLRETETRGFLLPGFLADLTIWDVNPLVESNPDRLKDLMPNHTIVGGKIICSS